MASQNRICKKMVYRGNVQGVGFRFTTQRLAERMGVDGFVRNEPDGSVLVIAEGDRAAVEEFIQAIESSSLGGHIANKAVEDEPTRNRSGFRIEY